MFRKLVIIEQRIGLGKHTVGIFKDNSIIGPIVIVKRREAKGILTSNLVQLGLVVIDDKWSYDPDGCLAQRKNPIENVSCGPISDSWRNSQKDDSVVYVNLHAIPKKERPPWLAFYTVKEKYDPTKKFPLHLSKKMREEKWPKDKKHTFWRYRQQIKEVKIGLGNLHRDE